MSQSPSDQGTTRPVVLSLSSLAEELKQVSGRLRQLAEKLQPWDDAHAEMVANYPHFKRAIYALLRGMWDRDLPPLPHGDLEALAAQDGALPLEAFLAEFEHSAERP
jgi:hypothetical protein